MAGVTSTKGYQFGALSSGVMAACIDVQRELGRHCMEIDYQRALELALKTRALVYDREVEIPIVDQGVTSVSSPWVCAALCARPQRGPAVPPRGTIPKSTREPSAARLGICPLDRK